MIKFKIGEEIVDEFEILRHAKQSSKPSTKTKEGPASFHKGWRVAGHPPRSMEIAQQLANIAWQRYQSMTPDERAKEYPIGKGAPKPWDESLWRRNSPLRPVRSEPYEVHAAAVECMLLAEKSGWIDLRIDEITKGRPDGGGMF